MMKKIIVFILLTSLFTCRKENVVPPVVSTEKYFPKVKAIVQHNCTVSCHAPSLGFMQGLPVILETDSDIVFKGPSIREAVAGPITITNHRMPPSGALSAADIDIISKWLTNGGRTTDCGLNQ